MRIIRPSCLYGEYIIFVDDEDYKWLNRHTWTLSLHGKRLYAVNGRLRLMHRTIMGNPKGLDVHHIDDNGLNNTRANLVVVSRGEHNRLRIGRLTEC
jgi:HNH endonuclease